MPVNNPNLQGWSWMRLSFTHIGQGIQFPLDGIGALAPGATGADRLAASQFSIVRRVLVGGWMTDLAPVTGALNVILRDVGDTVSYLIDALEVPAAGTDDRPWKFFPAPGLLLPAAFGVIVSGAATAGQVNVLYKRLE